MQIERIGTDLRRCGNQYRAPKEAQTKSTKNDNRKVKNKHLDSSTTPTMIRHAVLQYVKGMADIPQILYKK